MYEYIYSLKKSYKNGIFMKFAQDAQNVRNNPDRDKCPPKAATSPTGIETNLTSVYAILLR